MNHTIKAMTDLLFVTRDTITAIDAINNQLHLISPYDDMGSHIAPMAGEIESTMIEALDLFFEEITGHETLASHMLYETGRIVWNGVDFDLKTREGFDAFIAATTKEILSINNREAP